MPNAIPVFGNGLKANVSATGELNEDTTTALKDAIEDFRRGFETTMRLPAAGAAHVVEVRAIGPAGRVLGTSAPVAVG